MSAIRPLQTLVKPKQLAALLGVSPSTLHRWTIEDSRYRHCLFRRGYYSVQKLRDAKILTDAAPVAEEPRSTLLNDDLVRLAELCLVVAAKLKEEAGRRR